jgi:hypothetical protein
MEPDAVGEPDTIGDPGHALVPQTQHVYLLRRADQTFLVHSVTHEVREVHGVPEDRWELHFDDEGRAFVIDAAMLQEPFFADALFSHVLCEHSQSKRLFIARTEMDGTLTPDTYLDAMLQEHSLFAIKIAADAGALTVEIPVASFKMSFNGGHMMWSLHAVHHGLKLSEGLIRQGAGNWVSNQWKIGRMLLISSV